MSTTISARRPADFLALVPNLLGFHPVRSLVLVPFVGSRTLGGLRADLPDVADSDDLENMASTLIGLVCKVSQVDAVAVVVYTDVPLAGDAPLAHRALVDAVLSRADICGLRVVMAVAVGPDAWVSYLDAIGPRPVDELQSTGSTPLPAPEVDQQAAAELPRVDLARRERVARRLRLLGLEAEAPTCDTAASGTRHPRAAHALSQVDDPPLLFEDVLERGADALEIDDLAAMLYALRRPLLRDVALTQWASDLAMGDEALAAQLASLDGEPVRPDIAEVLIGEAPRPDPQRLRTALEICRLVAAVSPTVFRPGPLSAAAWTSWALGRSTHAAVYAQQARAIDPDHGLAGIVLALVDHQRLPEWAFVRSADGGAAPTSPAGRGSSRGCRAR